MARAKQSSCRWPWERLRPPSVIGDERWRKGFLFKFFVVPFGVFGTGGIGVAEPDDEEDELRDSNSSTEMR